MDIKKRSGVSTRELERRRKAVREAMKEKKLDVLILIVPGNIRWLTDAAPQGGSALVVPLEGLMRIVTGGPRVMPQPSPPPPAGFDEPLTAPMMPALEYTAHYTGELLVEALQSYKKARIGIAGLLFMNLGSYRYLTTKLNSASFEDATDLVDYIKVRKSDEELALIRETCRLEDELFQYALTVTKPGRMPFEVQADIARKWTDMAAEECAGGLRIARVDTQEFRDKYRKIEKEDHIGLLIEPRGPGGIWCEVARPVCFGKVPDKLAEMFRLAVEARHIFLSLLKPGVNPQILWEANNKFLRQHGYQEESRVLAHSLGYDMVERPTITPGETMPIPTRLNMGIHPVVKSEGHGWVCDNYFLHESGEIELLHKTPEHIFVI
jgi:ectoine hydrolase